MQSNFDIDILPKVFMCLLGRNDENGERGAFVIEKEGGMGSGRRKNERFGGGEKETWGRGSGHYKNGTAAEKLRFVMLFLDL